MDRYGDDDEVDDDGIEDVVDDEAGGGEAAERYDGDPGYQSEGDDGDEGGYKAAGALSDDESELDSGAPTVCGDLGGATGEGNVLEQLIAETETADVWGLHGGFWHSAFFGRTPSAFIHYHWFLKMLEDEQAEIRCVAVCVCVCVCLCLCVCVCVPCFCVRVNASREWGCKC